MKFILGTLGAVLFWMITPPLAQANSVQMQCPASVKEGGLVAQAAFDCPVDGLPIGKEYCEYRDGSGANDWSDFVFPNEGSIRLRPRAFITINATTGGEWIIVEQGTPLLISNLAGSIGLQRHTIQAGKTKKIELIVYGRANYRKEGNTTGNIAVIPPGGSGFGNAIASCTVTVQDDDKAYVGSRYLHPYRAFWQKMPHCYEVGCASRN